VTGGEQAFGPPFGCRKGARVRGARIGRRGYVVRVADAEAIAVTIAIPGVDR
jgi:hypothetical protein